MPLQPRLKPVLAVANRTTDDDLTMPARRLAGTIQARHLGRLVMRPGPKVPTTRDMELREPTSPDAAATSGSW